MWASAVASGLAGVHVDVTTVGIAILLVSALLYGWYVVRGLIDDMDYEDVTRGIGMGIVGVKARATVFGNWARNR